MEIKGILAKYTKITFVVFDESNYSFPVRLLLIDDMYVNRDVILTNYYNKNIDFREYFIKDSTKKFITKIKL